jgi:hypothetical protein
VISPKQNAFLMLEQSYLEKGDADPDSMHATLEQYLKPLINSLSDYATRMSQARSKIFQFKSN